MARKLIVVCLAAASVACARVGTRASGGGGAGGSASSGRGGSGGGATGAGGFQSDAGPPPPPLTDFPPDPILGTPTTPAGAPDLFGGTPRTSGAPCIASPEMGTLMPRNWLRPRFDYKAAGDENLFEIQLTVARFATPLRIYTTD